MRVDTLIVSPHLDDAVMSCGELIASSRSMVVTVFAGEPPEAAHTEWDARCGLQNGSAAIRTRRAEDREAVARLGGIAVHLPFLDDQYREREDDRLTARLAGSLASVIETVDPEVVVFPAGIGPADHRLTRDACLSVAARRPSQHWWVYAEAMYRRTHEDLVDALAVIEAAGFELHAQTPDDAALGQKIEAAHAYGSQLRGLDAVGRPIDDIGRPDRTWRLRRRSQP